MAPKRLVLLRALVAVASAALGTLGLMNCGSDYTVRDFPEAAAFDAGGRDAIGDIDASSVDPCAHAQPPTSNGDDNPTLDVGELSFVLRETHLANSFGYDAGAFDAGPRPNTAVGFDLDNACTCQPGLPHQAGPNSCRTAQGQLACDQPNGIDNQLPSVLAPLKVLAQAQDLDSLATINARIVSGDKAMIVVVRGYNGLANDKEVTVLIHAVTRPNRLPAATPRCIDAGSRPPSSAANDGPDGATYDPDRLPLFDGCDEWGDLVGTPAIPAYVANHVLVVRATVTIPIPIAGAIVDAESGVLTAVLVGDGVGGWTLEDGNLGGRGPVSSVLGAGGTLSLSNDAGPICLDLSPTGQLERTSLLTTACPAVDISASSSEDFYVGANGLEPRCDAISLGLAFRGERGFVGAPADGGMGTICADAGLTCPDDGGN